LKEIKSSYKKQTCHNQKTHGHVPFSWMDFKTRDLDKTKAIGLDAKKGDWIMGLK
jgi:hypothetical protein